MLLLAACGGGAPPPVAPPPLQLPPDPPPVGGPGHSAVRNGRIEVDGEPFFPHGYYYVSWDEPAAAMLTTLRTVAAAGFNTVHASRPRSGELTAFLDEAERLGVKVLLEGQVREDGCVQDVVRALASHRALLGWNIGDDVHANATPQVVRARHASCKRADPDHLTYSTVYDPEVWGPYLDIGDVVAPYAYPVPQLPLREVDRTLTLARAPGRPLLGIPQTFSQGPQRAPTAAEIRNMTYQALANGVLGLLHYNFNEGGQPIPERHPELWAETTRLVPEVRRLAPALTRGRYTRLPAGQGSIVAASWLLDGELFVVVINTHATQARSVSLALPATGAAQALFPGRPAGLQLRDGRLQGPVGAQEVHVYVLPAR